MSAKASLSFIARVNGKLVVSVDGVIGKDSGSGDWNTSSYSAKVYVTQGGTTTYANDKGAASGLYAGQGVFKIIAGAVECGLELNVGGVASMYIKNCTIRAHLSVDS